MRAQGILAIIAALACTVLVAGPATAIVNGVIYYGDRASHTIALTFDDGYDVAPCQAILAILLRERVPATFFPVGRYVAADPAFWREVSRHGFPIGDHSQTHPDMTRLTPAQQLAELVTSRATIERAIGHPMTQIFRPPYGDVNAQLVASAHRAGFRAVVYWDTDDRDTFPVGTDAQHIAAGTRGKNGSIVILHCGPAMTPRILPAIIASYRSRGFTFVTVPQMLGLPGPRPVFPKLVATPMPAPTSTPTPPGTPAPSPSPTATPPQPPEPAAGPIGGGTSHSGGSAESAAGVLDSFMQASAVPSWRAGLSLLVGCLLALSGVLTLDVNDVVRRRRAAPPLRGARQPAFN